MTVLTFTSIHGHADADAIRIAGTRIAAVGRSGDLARDGVATHVGGIAIPGLRDAHIHPLELAASGSRLDLTSARSFADVRDAIRRRAGTLGVSEPLIATGLDDERLAEGRMPTRHDLDAVLAARPLLVYRHCSHIASANSLALSLAGLDRSPVDPVGGRIRRDERGEPDGVLEETAIGSVSAVLAADVVPPDTESIRTTLGDLRSRGLVAIDAMVSAGPAMWCSGGDEIASLLALGDDVPIDVDCHVIAETPDELRSAARRLVEASDRIRFAGWKGFADGSLGGRTAALRAEYSDAPGDRGLMRSTDSRLRAMAEAASDLGGTAAIHAIGDAAVQAAVGIAERLDPGTVRIEHASVADRDLIARMAEAGVTASVQPSFVTSDADWIARRLGPRRIGWAYPFRSMVDAGVRVVGGSDAPIESPDPLVGIADAARPRPEALDIDDAIGIYADHPIAAGERADIVVVDSLPAGDGATGMPRPAILAMWVAGRKVR